MYGCFLACIAGAIRRSRGVPWAAQGGHGTKHVCSVRVMLIQYPVLFAGRTDRVRRGLPTPLLSTSLLWNVQSDAFARRIMQ